jgi:hypothetical protein
VVESASKGEAMWSLLARVAEDHQTCIILLREEFKRGSIFKGVYLVLLEELDCVGCF